MKISKKKMLIAIIVLFCLSLLIGFGLGLKQKAREKKEAEISRQKMEKETQVQNYIKTVEKMGFSEMVNLTEQLSKDLAFREKIKIYSYPFYLLIRHLRCKFLQEQNKEKKDALVDYAMEAYRRILYSNLNQNEAWERIKKRAREAFIKPEESFLYNLAFGNMAEICPDKLPINCRKDNGVFFLEPDEWCGRICETLAQYEKDKDKLNKEVINFKDQKEGVIDLIASPFYWHWRLAVAYRFGGKNLAFKICDNVAEAQKKNSCLSTLTFFETEGLACEAAFERLARLFYDYQYKNY